jgi:hypothetical protein
MEREEGDTLRSPLSVYGIDILFYLYIYIYGWLELCLVFFALSISSLVFKRRGSVSFFLQFVFVLRVFSPFCLNSGSVSLLCS